MGVDISTYRCRVGMFIPDHGARGVKIIHFSALIKIIGSLSFVKMLLIMSGIEQNPGPDTFTFRYQYLLVHVGTAVLRELFVVMAGNDIGKFLAAKSKDIQQLTAARMITAAQKQMLLSANYQPCIAEFDITLLSCLLRNICGLCPPRDQVWMNPVTTDVCIEADIARLRMCRNELMHSDKLRLPDAELKAKWKELSMILTRLNKKAGIAQLKKMIDDAEHMDVDEDMRNEHNEAMKTWEERDKIVDHGIAELKAEVSEVKHKVLDVKHEVSDVKHKVLDVKHEVSDVKHVLSDVKHEVTDVKHEVSEVKNEVSEVQHEVSDVKHEVSDVKHEVSDVKHEVLDVKHEVSDVKHEVIGFKRKLEDVLHKKPQHQDAEELKDIQEGIIEKYKYHFKALPVSPVFEDIDDDLLNVYQSPTMYSVEPAKKNKKKVHSYENVFCKDSKICNHIYIIGDAGVGKTSFCRRLCFLWYMAKCYVAIDNEALKKDVDYVAKFDFVFYITLRETRRIHVLDMIEEQYCDSEGSYEPKQIKSILRNKQCLVLLDGMDEWSPDNVGVKKYKTPEKVYSGNCVYLTTCRPYRLESVRLSHNKDFDHQIQLTGISGRSSKCYVKKLVDYMNQLKSCNKKSSDFEKEVIKCGLDEQVRIPIITSHLVVLWYEKTLSGLPSAVIYGNILEMLFERAEQRGFHFPPSIPSTHQLPYSLSRLRYLNKYVSFIYKVCYLSFCSMFKQDENVMSLVFTRDQLESDPYCFSIEETDFLCKIGILCRNEVFGYCSERKMKISFLHKSYIEFFAALFISSFDSSILFTDAIKTWKCLDDVLPYENLFILISGCSYDCIRQLIDNIYLQISDDLTLIRRRAAISNVQFNCYEEQINSLQNIIVNCFKQFCRSKAMVLKLEDFMFNISFNLDILRQLLLLNATFVKSIHVNTYKYYPEFDQIYCLQYLNVFRTHYDEYAKFSQCILQNKSTLRNVRINGCYSPLIPELAVRSLHHLTSLSLSEIGIQHNCLRDLVKFLSDNVLFENILLSSVYCDTCNQYDSDCRLTLNLPQHTKLTSLYLCNVNIICKNVNTSSLRLITLNMLPLSAMIFRLSCIDVLSCIKDSQLEHIEITTVFYMPDNDTMKTLASAIKSLGCIKNLVLHHMKIPDDVLLQLHPDVTEVRVELHFVTMSCQCFHCFTQSCVNKNSKIKVEFSDCNITYSVDGKTQRTGSCKRSVKYMSRHLELIPTIIITLENDVCLHFETTSCQ